MIFVCLNFILSLCKNILYAYQKAGIVSLMELATQIINFSGVLLFSNFIKASLFVMTIVYGCSMLIVNIGTSIVLYVKHQDIIPRFHEVDVSVGKDLTSLGIDNNILEPFKVKTKISKTENYFSNYITTYAFLFIIMAITVSSTYPATDTTAGEKERGTLETLLTFPIKSRDIILGKFLGVSISSIITGMISLILTIISLYIANNSFELYKDVNLMLPVSAYIFVSIIIVAYSLLISGLCIAIASKAKTFKEAQSALTPLTFITFFPGMIALIMNIKLTPVLSLIPFLNYNLIFQDIINNKYDIVNILCMFISTVVVIGIVLKIIIKQYKSERVLFE